MPPSPSSGPSASWIAFLVVPFLVVGLTGLFVTFGAPLTLERQAAREAALDDAAMAARQPDSGAALARLRPRLADSADAVLGAQSAASTPDRGAVDERIARERTAMRARFAAEQDATLVRLRWLVCVVTLMGAAFGVLILRLSQRAA